MFARATNSAYICLRCQRRLVKDNLQPPKVTDSASTSLLRRWRSTAAAVTAVEDDEHADFHAEDQKPAFVSLPENPRRQGLRDTKYRKWRPSRTAELGVNSLGKPAEVLILPSRDRKIPEVPKGSQDISSSTDRLQESLDSGRLPLSRKELLENIEQTRQGIDKKRGQLELKESALLIKSLFKGFTHDQLKQYIRFKHARHLSSQGLDVVAKRNKIDTIRYVVEEVWGYTIHPADRSLQSVLMKNSTLSFFVRDEARFDYLLTARNQPLKRIAATFDVQIEVFWREFRIKVTGVSGQASKAVAAISNLARSLEPTVIQLNGTLGEAYRDPALTHSIKPFFKSIQQKHQVNIAATEKTVEIIYLNQSRRVQQAHREIRLAGDLKVDRQKVGLWLPSDNAASSLLPYPTPAEFPWALSQFSWGRLIASSGHPPTPSPPGVNFDRPASLDSMVNCIHTWLQPIRTIPQPESRGDLHLELTAQLGQALFRDFRGPNEKEERGKVLKDGVENDERDRRRSELEANPGVLQLFDKKSSKDDIRGHEDVENKDEPEDECMGVNEKGMNSDACTVEALYKMPRFTGGAPYLPQQLATRKQWVQQPKTIRRDTSPEARAILRLEFSPVVMKRKFAPSPNLEVFITSGEAREGKRSPLKVARVTAIHDEKAYTILCPDRLVDVRIVQQVKQDIGYPGAHNPIHRTLLSTLQGYFSRAESETPTEWVFPPFVSLPVHHSLQNVAKNLQNAIRPGQVYKAPDPPKKTVQGREVAVQRESVDYILRTVDVVDVDSRLVSATPVDQTSKSTKGPKTTNLCLDHITFTGTETTKQTLRLSTSSLLYPPDLKQPALSTLTREALKLAGQLGNDPTKVMLVQSKDAEAMSDAKDDITTEKGTRLKENPQKSRIGKKRKAKSQPETKASGMKPTASES
ncbi:uncharacterized protein Z518_04226 [Rhinocladiella mackenziei CBS 650.93]|uniref:Uncharacterized protein n=1 Tax=Rhinocladiella mackenziei CBS 650.93 TaxID=1442369 RepID=A0A0D2ISU0_9EURO|nr:uncharacterized protein Z518_04226 [Rhinocladiella mackenziei CBS 650.93]KIX06251.1 hypothetical protein Z518_04226 [Rhinocladiella mackenziei CBS 650.93]